MPDSIKKPTVVERRRHIVRGISDGTCLICRASPMLLKRTGIGSESRCIVCGAIYSNGDNPYPAFWLASMKIDPRKVSKVHLRNFIYLPVYRMYWIETGKILPLGGRLNRPFTNDDEAAFYGWILKNRQKLEVLGYKDNFAWDDMDDLLTRRKKYLKSKKKSKGD